MKKIDLGQTISILANIGVIAGIIFLAIEIQQNNELLVSQARIERIDARKGVYDLLLNNHELRRVSFQFANEGRESLSPDDRYLLEQFHALNFVNWEALWLEYEAGFLNVEDLSIESRREQFVSQDMAESWQAIKGRFDLQFVNWVDSNIASR